VLRAVLMPLAFLAALLAGCAPAADEPAEEAAPASTEAQAAPFEPGERIVFFGDSITEQGAQPGGYVALLADTIAQTYPDLGVEVIGAGISGNKVPDLLARVERDVLSQDPSTVVVYIGINDVWHWELNDNGTTEEAYEAGLRTLVDTLQQAGADVVLCTPSVIGERADGTNAQDAMLDRYADISRQVAADNGLAVCDLRADFLAYLQGHNPEDTSEGVLTTDGVHLNAEGNRFVADRIFDTLTR
jgi:lysophospholipase L1-like esterase